VSTSQPPPIQLEGAAPGWGERLRALGVLPAFLALVWNTHRGYTATVVVLRLSRALVPVATLWVAKLIIDEVVAAARGDPDPSAIWRYVALEVAIAVAGDLMGRASSLLESLLGDLFSNRVSVQMMEHATTLDLEQFEDPSLYDRMERARQQSVARMGLLAQLLAIGQDAITLATLAAALLAFSPWLGLLLAVTVVPSFLGENHFASLQYSLLFRATPERRQLAYLRTLASSDRSVKEVQMFGMSGWLIRRYRYLADRFYAANRRLALRRSVAGSLLGLLGTAGYYAAYVVILLGALAGRVTVGELTFLGASFARSRDLIQRLLLALNDIYQQCLYVRDLFVFFEARPRISSTSGTLRVPEVIREGFVFEGVGFRYPGRDQWAVRRVSFRISPGECVALVGENGAGKTTLTKLLGRLYDPDEGRITLEGVDLRSYDLNGLRGVMGVIFQDFVRYDLRLDENIAVGQVEAVAAYLQCADSGGEPPPVPRRIVAAAEMARATTLLPRLPAGYRQMLGRTFEGGVNLSGGEWQKVALARAYMRDAELLILDEPTAALDARAETEIFQRFQELTRDRMSVVISHRFSTVRRADRIVVLSGGEMVEEGSHDELLALHGLYSELFGMQAAGYR
jgi:ATP-binding cassette, subfamily B, bacterial